MEWWGEGVGESAIQNFSGIGHKAASFLSVEKILFCVGAQMV